MNNTFSMNRFALLIRKQWLEYGKLYLIALGIVAGVIIAVYSYMYWQIMQPRDSISANVLLQLNFRWPLFLLFGVLFLTLSANHYFAPLGQKPRAILELTLPASSTEKFFVGILYSSIFALIAYCLIFYLVDVAFVSKLRSQFPDAVATIFIKGLQPLENHRIPLYAYEKIANLPLVQTTPLIGSVFLSSIFVLGSLCFKKFQYIKTVITTLVFLGVWVIGTSYLGRYIFENRISADNSDRFNASSPLVGWGVFAIFLALTIITYTIAYVRFKEKEV